MSTKTPLLMLGLAALGVAYLLAAHVQGIGMVSVDPDHPLTDCETLNARVWFTQACHPSMMARVDVLAVGAVVFLVCVVAAGLVRVHQ